MENIIKKFNENMKDKKKNKETDYDLIIKQMNNDGILNIYKNYYLQEIPKNIKNKKINPNNQKKEFLYLNKNDDIYENLNKEILSKNEKFFNSLFE